MAALRRLVRLPALVALLVAGLLVVLFAFPFSNARFRRVAIRTWSRALCAACGVALAEAVHAGARPLSELPGGRMVVANHVSWLDVFAIDALCPASFVAKAEIRRWPLVGTLVARTGTLFLERGRRHAVHRMVERIDRTLQAGGRVAVFPEGTTGEGDRLLPFHANLVQGAVLAGAPVVPVALRWTDRGGERPDAVEFVGDTAFPVSVWRITGASGLRCEVVALPELSTIGEGRHAVAGRARTTIAAALGVPLDDTLPDRLERLRPRRAAASKG